MAASDIEIQFQNDTEIDSAIVMLFARPYPVPLNDQTVRMAWRFLLVPPNGSSKFFYPQKNLLSAFFYEDGANITAGPFEAEPGSTWTAIATSKQTVTLEQDTSCLPVPDGGYVIYNNEPDDWTGRVLNVGLFKGEDSKRPLVSVQCRIGNYVVLSPTDKIYICAMIPAFSTQVYFIGDFLTGKKTLTYEPVDLAKDFKLLADSEFTPMTEIDLLEYGSKGIYIQMIEEPSSGKLSFQISPAEN